MRHAAWIICIFISLVAFDRTVKLALISSPALAGAFALPGVIGLIHHENHGIIANLPVPQPLIILVTTGIIGLILVGLVRAFRRNDLYESLALTIILAGAFGNLWDRLQYGYVFDWLLLFGRSAVNIADGCIAIGAVWYLFEWSTDSSRTSKQPIDTSV